jgi:hypothetical protein
MASEDSNFTGADWQPYSTAPSFNLSPVSASPETKTVYFKVKNSFAESSPAKSDTITVSGGLPPVVTSFKINAGAASTANSMVTLNNTGTNSPMYYAVSESPTFVGATWQTYSTAPKITLSAESGTKTVYFKTMNIFGESLCCERYHFPLLNSLEPNRNGRTNGYFGKIHQNRRDELHSPTLGRFGLELFRTE